MERSWRERLGWIDRDHALALDEGGGEQRNHDFVMAGDGVAVSAGARMRAFDHVDFGPIMLQEIEVDRGEISQRMAEVAHHGNRFQEYFWQHHGRANIEIDAAVIDVFDERTEQPKIMVRRTAQNVAFGGGMRMRRVCSDGDVHGDRSRVAIRLRTAG